MIGGSALVNAAFTEFPKRGWETASVVSGSKVVQLDKKNPG